MDRRLEVPFVGLKDIGDKFLGIAVDEGKPSALDVDHDPMSALECMANIV